MRPIPWGSQFSPCQAGSGESSSQPTACHESELNLPRGLPRASQSCAPIIPSHPCRISLMSCSCFLECKSSGGHLRPKNEDERDSVHPTWGQTPRTRATLASPTCEGRGGHGAAYDITPLPRPPAPTVCLGAGVGRWGQWPLG